MIWLCLAGVTVLLCFARAAIAATVPISAAHGSDLAQGSKEQAPLATLQAALGRARPQDTSSPSPKATLPAKRRAHAPRPCVTLQGGWNNTFDKRDPFLQASRVTTNVASQPILDIGSQAEEVLVDGVELRSCAAGGYSSAVCGDCLAGAYSPAQYAPLVQVSQAGRLSMRNVVFVNGAGGGLRADILGEVELDNVAFINQRPFAINASANCGYASPVCGDLAVRNASILWTWREAPDDQSSGGSALFIGAGVRARIERAIIAYSDAESASNSPLVRTKRR